MERASTLAKTESNQDPQRTRPLLDNRSTSYGIMHTNEKPKVPRQKEKNDASTGLSAASARAFTARAIAFYFRAPMKAFFRTRIDYMAFARAINPHLQAKEAWSWKTTTPGLLSHAIRTYGWSFIPIQVLPPLVANIFVGSVLYTTYLQALSNLHPPSSTSIKRAYPPPPPSQTMKAGLIAGFLQSLLASPLDALQVRFKTADLISGKYKDMWHYSYLKAREIGPRGIFAGWGISALKDSFGCALFFCTFEYVKAQGFYAFAKAYYGDLQPRSKHDLDGMRRGPTSETGVPTIRPHFIVEPAFLMLAGISASISQQLVQYPLSLVQEIHYHRLRALDRLAEAKPKAAQTLRNYRHAYQKTFRQCRLQARLLGGWRRWMYRGFLGNTIRQIPSTSAGLVIFEVVRRAYAEGKEEVRIEKEGYDILLT